MSVSRQIRCALLLVLGSGCSPLESQYTQPPSAADADPSGILVTTEMLDRSTILLAVLDFHASVDSEDKGFDELRRRAAELGADAVMHAEFEHGEEGEESHLSGMAVRYAPPDDRPYDVLGELEIESAPSAEDKGLDELLSRAAAMGADEVRNIVFEHGEDGNPSRLRGTAVLHRKE